MPVPEPTPASASPDYKGRRLGGCRVVRLIGKGGMSEVYEAMQESLGRRVAVKILPPQLAADEQFVKRFERESGALAQLSHPNIVTIYDRGHEGDAYFFVLEYVEGKDGTPARTLYHRLRATEPLTVPEAVRLMQQVLEALEYAHTKGVVHRDIKPSNILLDARNNARLVDFGIAHIIHPIEGKGGSRLTTKGEALGTVGYVAPEQREGKSAMDVRADVFSAGVVFYEMLTGRLPEGAFETPSELVPGLDTRWNAVIEQALRRNPERRFQTMTEFLEAVRVASTPLRPRVVSAPHAPFAVPVAMPVMLGPDGRPSTVHHLTPIVGQCQKCHALNPGDTHYCGECGTTLYEPCPGCKSENRVGTKYCGHCGGDLAKLRRIEAWRKQADDLTARVKLAPSAETAELLLEVRATLDKILTDAPQDADAETKKKQIEAQFRAVRRAEADALVAEAAQKISDPVALWKRVVEVVASLVAQFPDDTEVAEQLQQVRGRLRATMFERAPTLRPADAITTYYELLKIFPGDTEAQSHLKAIEDEIASLKGRVVLLTEAGRYREALERLDDAIKRFGERPDLMALQQKAQEAKARMLKLAEEEIPLLWKRKQYLAMLQRLDELSQLRSEIEGTSEARAEAAEGVARAKEITLRADALAGAGKLREALAEYEKALRSCTDYKDARTGIEQARRVMAQSSRQWSLAVGVVIALLLGALLLLIVWSVAKRNDARDWKRTQESAEQAGDDDVRLIQLYDAYLKAHPSGQWHRDAEQSRAEIAARRFAVLAQQQRELERRTDWTSLSDVAREAVTLKPEDSGSWLSLGAARVGLRQWKEAAEAYRQFTTLSPNTAQGWNKLGFVYGQLEQWTEAAAACRRAIDLQSDDAGMWFNYGVALVNSGKKEDAIAPLERAVKLKPDHAEAWYSLGTAYANAGRQDDARDVAQRLSKLDPKKGNDLMALIKKTFK